MDVLTPGFRGLMKNVRAVRELSDYYLGRYSQMFEVWAKAEVQKLRPLFGGQVLPGEARDCAKTSYHYGRLASLCYREHQRRMKLGGRW